MQTLAYIGKLALGNSAMITRTGVSTLYRFSLIFSRLIYPLHFIVEIKIQRCHLQPQELLPIIWPRSLTYLQSFHMVLGTIMNK